MGIHESVSVYIYVFFFILLSHFQSQCHDPKRIYNSHIIINPQGSIIEAYQKLHLFDVNIKDGPIHLESNTTIRGEKICDPIPTPLGNLGLMVCYDLRFPELSLELRKRGADILTFPSAFTIKTGQAHWGK